MLLAVVPLAWVREEGWPAWSWLCLAASVPAFGLFFALERRVAAAGSATLVNVEVISRAAVAWALAALLIATGTYYALLFTSPNTCRTDSGRVLSSRA